MRPTTLLQVTLTLNVVVTIATMTLAYRALRPAARRVAWVNTI